MWQSHTFGPASLTGLIPESPANHAAAGINHLALASCAHFGAQVTGELM